LAGSNGAADEHGIAVLISALTGVLIEAGDAIEPAL